MMDKKMETTTYMGHDGQENATYIGDHGKEHGN